MLFRIAHAGRNCIPPGLQEALCTPPVLVLGAKALIHMIEKTFSSDHLHVESALRASRRLRPTTRNQESETQLAGTVRREEALVQMECPAQISHDEQNETDR